MVVRKELVNEVRKVNNYLKGDFPLIKVHEGRLWFSNTLNQYSSKVITGLPVEWDFEINGVALLRILNLHKVNEIELIIDDKTLHINGVFTSEFGIGITDLSYLNDYDTVIYRDEVEMSFDFNDKLAWVSQAVSRDDLRPHLCYTGFCDGQMFGTDGHRLFYTDTVGILKGAESFTMSKAFGVSGSIVRALLSNKQIVVSSGWSTTEDDSTSIIMHMNDGSTLIIQESSDQIPNAQRVIPDEAQTLEVTGISTEFYDHLLIAKDALSLVAFDRKVVLWLSEDTIHVGYIKRTNTAEPNASESISSVLEELGSCKATVSRLLIGTEMYVNIDYMLDALKGTFKKLPMTDGSPLMGTLPELIATLSFALPPENRGSRPLGINMDEYKAIVMPMSE